MSTLMKKRTMANYANSRKKARYTKPMMPSPELKFLDTSSVSALVATAGVIHAPSLNLIAQGTGESERVGRKVTVRAIHGKIHFKMPASAATSNGAALRLMLVKDKQANGAAPAVTDVLQAASWLSFNNLDNGGRFQTLWEHVESLNPESGSGGTSRGVNNQFREFHITGVSIPIEYSGGVGVIGEVRSNNLFLLAISDAAQGDVVTQCRLRYTDS